MVMLYIKLKGIKCTKKQTIKSLLLHAWWGQNSYGCHKIWGAFSEFYYRHSELVVEYNVGLEALLQQGVSGPVFCGGLVCGFGRVVGKPNFSDQFKKIVGRYIRVGYSFGVVRRSACLVLGPIAVYSYGFLFGCAAVGRASGSVAALAWSFNRWVGA